MVLTASLILLHLVELRELDKVELDRRHLSLVLGQVNLGLAIKRDLVVVVDRRELLLGNVDSRLGDKVDLGSRGEGLLDSFVSFRLTYRLGSDASRTGGKRRRTLPSVSNS